MDRFIINGGHKLSGCVHINGAKNAASAVVLAAITANGVCVIENLPKINDVSILAEAIRRIGAKCEFIDGHTLRIDSSEITGHVIEYDLVRSMRASYYLLGSLLARLKKAVVPMPGGCNLGARPIDQHIKAFEALGAKVTVEHGMVSITADKLTGTNIYLDVVSVGATINAMIASTGAEGVTLIENAAKEPHVVDTANFLNMLGANIRGAGTDTIRIVGSKKLSGCDYMIIPDQIEAGTYMIATAVTGGDVTIKNIIPRHMESLSAKLTEMNCKIEDGDDYIRITRNDPLICANVKTMVYPGFPTDLQPQMTALLTLAKGTSIITETIHDNRFQYITELRRLGGRITVDGRIAIIENVDELTGAEVSATDLRAGVALIIAGLAARGETTIYNIKYIDRGYESIDKKLKALGADIKRA